VLSYNHVQTAIQQTTTFPPALHNVTFSCILTPPYTGPPLRGLTKASDIAFWTAFIKIGSDNAISNPADADEFLFYSGIDS
jgi:hypothetical protein